MHYELCIKHYALLTLSQVGELEVLTFGRRELRAAVNALAQVIDNAIVAIQS
jgi:hypothetical protein